MYFFSPKGTTHSPRRRAPRSPEGSSAAWSRSFKSRRRSSESFTGRRRGRRAAWAVGSGWFWSFFLMVETTWFPYDFIDVLFDVLKRLVWETSGDFWWRDLLWWPYLSSFSKMFFALWFYSWLRSILGCFVFFFGGMFVLFLRAS